MLKESPIDKMTELKHFSFIRDLPDVKTGGGPCEISHIRKYSNCGIARKPPPNRVLPQAHEEHMRVHSKGELTYWAGETGLRNAIELAELLFKHSGDYQTCLELIRTYRKIIFG